MAPYVIDPNAANPEYPLTDYRCDADCVSDWEAYSYSLYHVVLLDDQNDPSSVRELELGVLSLVKGVADEKGAELERAAKIKAALGPDAGNAPVDTSSDPSSSGDASASDAGGAGSGTPTGVEAWENGEESGFGGALTELLKLFAY